MLPDGSLAGRVAVVTGGGTGLGRAMALELGRLDAKVAVLGRRREPLDETVAQLDGDGFAVQADVRDPDAVAAAFEAAEEALGPLTTLVNNAAGNFLVRAEELSPNGWRAVVGIVLDGTFHCSRELGRRVIARTAALREDSGPRERVETAAPAAEPVQPLCGAGEPAPPAERGGANAQIVNVVATYAWTGGPGTVHSAAAKAGVVNLTRTLAVEWARYGIRVNAIAPGPIDTEETRERLWPTEEIREQLLRRIPLGRFGREEEIAHACSYLVSDYAGYVTGDVLTVDGGSWLEKGMFRG
jgi:NAD(P)-dependent dehydrogenase (short-subunit alcohol dehydrogenase family)